MSEAELELQFEKRLREVREDYDTKIDKVFGHVETYNHEMGKVQAHLEWLKKGFWVVATASVGAFVAALFNIITK